MLDRSVTHYFPYDDSDTESDEYTYCGQRVTPGAVHALTPTCPGCQAAIARREAEEAALEALIEADGALPLDADEAASELDPVLNAGIPDAPTPRPAFVDDLFAVTVRLTRMHAAMIGGRR